MYIMMELYHDKIPTYPNNSRYGFFLTNVVRIVLKMYPIDVDQGSSSLVQNLWAGYEESENISDFSMQDGEISCRYFFKDESENICAGDSPKLGLKIMLAIN